MYCNSLYNENKLILLYNIIKKFEKESEELNNSVEISIKKLKVCISCAALDSVLKDTWYPFLKLNIT